MHESASAPPQVQRAWPRADALADTDLTRQSLASSTRSSHTQKAFLAALAGLTLLAAGLRLYRIDVPSLWVDELFTMDATARMAQGDWGVRPLAFVPSLIGLWVQGVDAAALPIHGYEQWRQMGVTPGAIRLPYALIGIVSVPLLAWASQRLIGQRAALMLALLLAVSPWHVWMSQTARFYVQQFLFYNLALVAYLLAVQRRAHPAWGVMAVCVALAFGTQPTSLMLMGVFGLEALLARLRGESLGWGRLGTAALAMAVAACLGLGLYGFFHTPTRYTEFEGSQQSLLGLLLATPYLADVAIAALAGLTAIAMATRQPRLCACLALGGLLPIVTFAALGALGADVHLRYTFVGLFCWLMLAAIGLDQLWQALRPRLGVTLAAAPAGMVLASLALSNYGYFTGGCGYRPPWRDTFAYVAAHRQAGEAVAGPAIAHQLARYYLQDPDVVIMRTGRMLEDLAATDRPTWVVLQTYSSTGGRIHDWVHQAGRLEAHFTTRILQPYSAVSVYYYQPGSADDAPLIVAASSDQTAQPHQEPSGP
ncbi:MAG TPA: glycosyltransferase family 39 protein [Phycisphaeraceae bacterium]